MKQDHKLRDLFDRAVADTGVVIPYDTFRDAHADGRLLLTASLTVYTGFLFFVETTDKDTGQTFWIERMLWVDPANRDTGAAQLLVERWERTARKKYYLVDALLAGASLEPDTVAAKHVYTNRGFRSTHSFRKDITHV
jgi:GNAT superfamily N-acetyltransferase